jgi:hypothetical protein
MNTDEIKKRLARLQERKTSTPGNGKRWRDNFWKPESGKKHEIRLLKYKHSDDTLPFTELYFYFNIGKPRMLSLVNFDETDPILEFSSELRKQVDIKDPKMKKLLSDMKPKMRVFTPVIVRGEEDKGVRMWEFGPAVYTELLQYMDDEDYGNILDVKEGFDIKLEVIPAEQSGQLYPTTNVRMKPRTSPLSEDAELVEKWLEDQPNVKKLYNKVEYDEMKSNLQEWVGPKLEGSGGEELEGTNYTNTPKKDVNKQLDSLFDED